MKNTTINSAINHLERDGYSVDVKNEWHDGIEYNFDFVEKDGFKFVMREYPSGIIIQQTWAPSDTSVNAIGQYLAFINAANGNSNVASFFLQEDSSTRIDGIYIGGYDYETFNMFLAGFELDVRGFCRINPDIQTDLDFILAADQLHNTMEAYA